MTFTATGNNTCIWGSKKTAYNAAEDTVDLINENSQLVYNADSAQGYGSSVKIGDTELLSGVSYTIRNIGSNMLLDLENGNPADGTNIRQWGKLGVSPQEWRIIAENDGYCRIASMVDESKCVSVSENSGTNGLNVELQTFTGSDNQLWKLIRNGSRYGIVSKCSDDKSGLDVFEMSTEYGANIDQWEYWGGEGQKFVIEPVPKETEIRGDINADGKFNIADVVLLQKWLLAVPVVHLDNWEAGDFFEDGRVNVFDLCLMKRELTEK